jgi:hypothetical protein
MSSTATLNSGMAARAPSVMAMQAPSHPAAPAQAALDQTAASLASPAGLATALPAKPMPPLSKRTHSPFVPVLLAVLALAGWLTLQLLATWQDQQALQSAYAAQQTTVDNAVKLRTSLDVLAADTQRLADAGNPNAGLLVAELRKRGITINTAANSAAPAASR